jgi:competence ComEA-like helix-hairpin-helix protein
MTGPARTPLSIGWSRGDRAALTLLLALAAAGLALRAAARTAAAGGVLPVDSTRVKLVTERIDPNTASAASLRRLPGIGPTKAQEIVRFRDAVRARGRRRPFVFAEDLAEVPGIGPSVVRAAADHLALARRGARPPAGP